MHARLRTKSFAAGTALIQLVLVGLIQLTIIGVGAIVTTSATGVLTISGAASGTLAWGLLAILLTLATIALFTWIGGRIYRGAILHTGGRVKLADAIRG